MSSSDHHGNRDICWQNSHTHEIKINKNLKNKAREYLLFVTSLFGRGMLSVVVGPGHVI